MTNEQFKAAIAHRVELVSAMLSNGNYSDDHDELIAVADSLATKIERLLLDRVKKEQRELNDRLPGPPRETK